jgi:type I restriction enzyme S subunit
MIPEEWQKCSVDDFLKDHKGAMKIGPFGSQLKKDTLVSTGYKVYGQENIFEKSFSYGNRYITEDHFQRLRSCELHAGDFIISMMGTIGKCMIVPGGIEKGIMDSHLLRLQLDDKVILPDFLSQLFISPSILDQVKRLSVGGIMDGLSSKIVKSILFLLPPLPEQRKIADILSSVDDAIQATRKVIDQTERVKQGLLQELLTRGIGHTEFKQTEIGEIPVGWEVVELGVVAKFSQGIQVEIGLQLETQTPDFVRFIRIVDYTQSTQDIRYIPMEIATKGCVSEDDVVMVRYGASAGFVGRGIRGAIANNLFTIEPRNDSLSSSFIYEFLKSDSATKKYVI